MAEEPGRGFFDRGRNSYMAFMATGVVSFRFLVDRDTDFVFWVLALLLTGGWLYIAVLRLRTIGINAMWSVLGGALVVGLTLPVLYTDQSRTLWIVVGLVVNLPLVFLPSRVPTDRRE